MRLFSLCLVLANMLFLSGCVESRPVEDPIPTIFYPAHSSQLNDSPSHDSRSQDLYVFLPGRGDAMDAFESNGFIEMLRTVKPEADAVAIDAHMTYYEKGQMADQVSRDVLKPYRQKGYQNIILVGISLGGYGALWLSNAYPQEVSSVILLAPFLGMNPLIERIENAGGISQWRAQLDHEPAFGEQVWLWADDLRNQQSGLIETAILGYGERDRFSGAAKLMATAIPAAHVFTADGGHDWSAWKQLWAEIIASPAFADPAFTNPASIGPGVSSPGGAKK